MSSQIFIVVFLFIELLILNIRVGEFCVADMKVKLVVSELRMCTHG